MKNHHKIKLIAASVALMTSFGAMAGLGGLNVQSHLGEPFLGTITVTGEEARTLLNGGRASISNSNLRVSVRRSNADKAVVNIRSTQPIQDPVLIFKIGVGNQSREYTAIIDPAGYNGKSGSSARAQNNAANRVEAAPANTTVDRQAARERINRVIRSGNADAGAGREVQNRRQGGQPAPRYSAKPKAQTEYGGIAYGKRHLVREGQTLTGIASRIRPQGLTLEQTIQALVNANPDVFINNDADRMLAGKVLSIPSRAEFEKYLGRETPASTPSGVPADAADTAPTTPVQTPASEPAGVQASEPAVDPEAVPQPDEMQATASAVSASEVLPAETGTAEPAAPAITEAPAAYDEAVDSGESSWWRWLLLGGAALIALYLLSKLFGRRKLQPEPDEFVSDRDESIAEAEESISEFKSVEKAEQDSSVNAAKVAAAAAAVGGAAVAAHAAQKTAGELEVEDDFGDDIFFTGVEETTVEKQSDVDLDLNAIDTAQTAIVSGAVTHDEETEKRRDADWDTIESTESVYEPEPENPYISSDITTESPVFEDASAPIAETFTTEQPSEREFWDFEVEDTQAGKAAEELEESLVSGHDTAAAGTSAFVSQSHDAAGLETVKSDVDEPLEFVQPDTEQEQVIDAAFEPNPALRDEAVETEVAAEPELFHIQQAENLSLQDADDFDAEFTPVAESDETFEWDAIGVTNSAESSDRDLGFISESVGMTAPLEAKYELAKMYVEIGDPEAARETLQELLEEADGLILTKAKAMLQELDG